MPYTLIGHSSIDEQYVFVGVRKDGTVTEIQQGGPTEEGFYNASYEYWFEDGNWMMRVTIRQRDCDGSHDNMDLFSCPGDFDLDQNKGVPAWTRVDYTQRDHFAESMGY